jgi:hypothetical protein
MQRRYLCKVMWTLSAEMCPTSTLLMWTIWQIVHISKKAKVGLHWSGELFAMKRGYLHCSPDKTRSLLVATKYHRTSTQHTTCGSVGAGRLRALTGEGGNAGESDATNNILSVIEEGESGYRCAVNHYAR